MCEAEKARIDREIGLTGVSVHTHSKGETVCEICVWDAKIHLAFVERELAGHKRDLLRYRISVLEEALRNRGDGYVPPEYVPPEDGS